jgi:hypothetical protein
MPELDKFKGEVLKRFEEYPVLCWTIDDWEQFYSALKEQDPDFDVQSYTQQYAKNSFEDINLLFESAPFKLNLGGKTEKSKLVTTDKPMGIFDFSLASRGLYKVPEYYSEKLAVEFPDKFKEFELPSGVVPPNLVTQSLINGEKIYTYQDGNDYFDCIIRQKGETAIEDGIQGAKLKYATRNRKVYLTHKRNKGKVKYVEIYSLFYYTSLNGDTQFAIRHIPAMMVAEYLESIGVKTRIYMTRFVTLSNNWTLREKNKSGVELPMYKEASNPNFYNSLLIQPIIAKEFGQDFDKELGFMISSQDYNQIYEKLAMWAVKKEVVNKITNRRDVYGNPDFSQIKYYEGIERYRNKYQEYVKLGLFKSKEVLPEAMLFFHDMVIKERMSSFINRLINYFPNYSRYNETGKLLTNVNVNPFFNWWMRLSATNLKNKIEIINSNELRKDLAKLNNEVYEFIVQLDNIVENTDETIVIKNTTSKLKDFYKELGTMILKPTDEDRYEFGYDIIDNDGKYDFRNYISIITNEITTYAEGIYFGTDEDTKEKRNELLENVLRELENF